MNPIETRTFVLAGNARLTLTSRKSGTRFTFRIRAAKNGGVHFVQLLSGPDNDSDYTYLGTIFNGQTYVHGKKSPIGREAPSAKAFAWAAKYLLAGEPLPECDIHHEGRCGRCGRALTVPSSIESGIGPDCAEKMAA